MSNGHFFEDLSVGQTVEVMSPDPGDNRARMIEGETSVLVASHG